MTDTTGIAFVVDGPPVLMLWKTRMRLVSEANQREHWAKKSARVKSHRDTARLLSLDAKKLLDRAPLEVLITRIAPRKLDDDNNVGACKATSDGIADAMGINDRDPRVTWLYDQRKGMSNEYAVEVVVRAKAKEAA